MSVHDIFTESEQLFEAFAILFQKLGENQLKLRSMIDINIEELGHQDIPPAHQEPAPPIESILQLSRAQSCHSTAVINTTVSDNPYIDNQEQTPGQTISPACEEATPSTASISGMLYQMEVSSV